MGKHPFSRGYEVILPSSFNIVLSSALVYSTCSPVSIWVWFVLHWKNPNSPNSTKFFLGSLLACPIIQFTSWKKKTCGLVAKQLRHFCIPIRLKPFEASLGTNSFCVNLLNAKTLELFAIMFFIWFIVIHVNIFTSDISKCCHQQPFLIYRQFVKKGFKNSYHKPLIQITTQEKATIAFI